MLKKLSQFTLALIGLTVLFSSCKKDYESIQVVDGRKIQDYITANKLTVTEDSLKSGYFYQILTQGAGTVNYATSDTVLYNVTVKGLENGNVYWASAIQGNRGTLAGYVNGLTSSDGTMSANIPALRDVVLRLKPGGSARILLPSYLAYGKNGVGVVPSNENIDLLINTFPEKSQNVLDDRLINDFIKKNSLTMTKGPTRVYYNVSTAGTGTTPISLTSTITAKYTGRFLDGTVFDSNTDGTFVTTLNSLVLGWGDVIPGKLTKGGKIRILIPSDRAYGSAGKGSVPSNAVLDFDIEIVDVTN
ncbi:FKBP-type peptidyl-prolyl cis-trans isomerase [Pedobacter cryoconitis]|uniref:Peptidyl-prolyl cis-trans isomerase n=1 Tax=Pedobacter cryoconitis TaxID=188932 RepID=A0A7W8ZM99_9SPHI|nr:FKBP-type peptidyl-prolyl cis-trans isomerase [Pedobacter cryoconitis]MBB5636448.1 FKBP-type peptidyl-prolyl cis-trans isomerase [Pedobacter cryoconitis]MBB6274496.1 FKBP-type peptidyl-prolyl cis-trans isomerase [Pedobacter cryoconitis]